MIPQNVTPALLSNALAVIPAGSNFANMATSIYQQIKTGVAILYGLVVNTGGTTSALTLYDGTSSIVTISIAVPGVISWPAHNLPAGSAVIFQTTGALPTGLTAGTTYYVSTVGLAAGAFSVADTKAHALAGTNTITTTGTQSGVQTGYNVSNIIGTFGTTAQVSLPIGNGVQVTNGILAVATDGGGAANLTILFI